MSDDAPILYPHPLVSRARIAHHATREETAAGALNRLAQWAHHRAGVKVTWELSRTGSGVPVLADPEAVASAVIALIEALILYGKAADEAALQGRPVAG
jgi:hypothetical protein